MRTTINLEPDAYRLARALAAKRNVSLGKVLGDALMRQFQQIPGSADRIETARSGFPVVFTDRVITPEDVRAAIEEE